MRKLEWDSYYYVWVWYERTRGWYQDFRFWLSLKLYYPKHIENKYCWCYPECVYEDPITENRVLVHNDIQ